MHFAVKVFIKNVTNFKQLTEELAKYEAYIADLKECVYVYAGTGISLADISDILKICNNYGICEHELVRLKH